MHTYLNSILHLQSTSRSIQPVTQQQLGWALQLVELPSCTVKILSVQIVLRPGQDAQHVRAGDKTMPLEPQRRKEMRCQMREDTGVLVWDERDLGHVRRNRGDEPRREVAEGLDTNVGHIAPVERCERGGDDRVAFRGIDLAQGGEFLSERFAHRAVDGCGGQRSEGSPEVVEVCAVIEVGGVVEDDMFEALDVGGKFVELGEAFRAFVSHAVFEVEDPALLHLDCCWGQALLVSVGVILD